LRGPNPVCTLVLLVLATTDLVHGYRNQEEQDDFASFGSVDTYVFLLLICSSYFFYLLSENVNPLISRINNYHNKAATLAFLEDPLKKHGKSHQLCFFKET
jgi:hypothetical protein